MHRGHEQPECATEREAHYAGHDGFSDAGLHCALHLANVSRLAEEVWE